MCSSARDWCGYLLPTGLTEVERVSAKLAGAQVVAVTELPQAMSLFKHNPSTNFGKPLEPAVGLSRADSHSSIQAPQTKHPFLVIVAPVM